LLLRRAQVHKQVECGVDCIIRPCCRPVHLVDHHDGLQALVQRLAQHKPRLRHGAFHCVDQQQHAVHHVHDALDLAPEIRVPGRVDNVDRHSLVHDARVLGEDGDAPLSFQVVRVENPFHHLLIAAEDVRLAQHSVNQRRLAVINMRDDRHIANVLANFPNSRPVPCDGLIHTPPCSLHTKRPAPF